MKSVCVYCASSLGDNPQFLKSAQKLGLSLANKDIQLVYGGASLGLMGVVADACLQNKGKVLGVIPRFLDEVEITHKSLTETIITESMHDRKMIMAEKADAFIAMPGGFGTLEELMEVLTWSQLGLIHKPIGILNVDGYYDSLLTFFDHMRSSGLIKESNLKLFVVSTDVEDLLNQLNSFKINAQTHREKLGLV